MAKDRCGDFFHIQASVRLTQGLLMAADAGVLLTLPLARPVKVQH